MDTLKPAMPYATSAELAGSFAAEKAAVTAIAGPWSHHTAGPVRLHGEPEWPGVARARWIVGVDIQAAGDESTPAGGRASLLARAEEVIEAYAEAGWRLARAPEFQFQGSLDPATLGTGGEMIKAPREYGIGLTLGLFLFRAVPAEGQHPGT